MLCERLSAGTETIPTTLSWLTRSTSRPWPRFCSRLAHGFNNVTEMTHHALFGIFMLNPYHHIVHIGIGTFWLLGAFVLTPAGNEGLNISIGGIYARATVIGFLGYLSLLSIPAGFAVGDNWLHLVTAVATLIFGSGLLSAMSSRQTATA